MEEVEEVLNVWDNKVVLGELIATGHHDSKIWEASWGKKEVVLKTIPRKYDEKAKREKQVYQYLQSPYLLGCFSCQKTRFGHQFLLAKADSTLYQLIDAVKNGNIPSNITKNRSKFLHWAKNGGVELWEPPSNILWKADGPSNVPSSTLLNLIREIIEAVVYLHDRGVAHGHLNPHSILIARNNRNKKLSIKLSLSRCTSSYALSSTSARTRVWLSPEQLEGHHGEVSSDLYSLGHIIYFAMTGEHIYGDFNDVDWCEESITHGRLVDITRKLPSEAAYVVKSLLWRKPTERQEARFIGSSPMFWTNMKKASFICLFHSMLDGLSQTHDAYHHFNVTKKRYILNHEKDWFVMTDQDLLSSYVLVKNHVSPKITSLIRFIRNILQHLKEYRIYIEGATTIGIAADFLLQPFPNLIMICLDYVLKNMSEDEGFRKFLLAE